MVNQKESEKTTIAILKSTKDQLDSCGTKGMTYDEIIFKLIEDSKR